MSWPSAMRSGDLVLFMFLREEFFVGALEGASVRVMYPRPFIPMDGRIQRVVKKLRGGRRSRPQCRGPACF
jgi:hypothetical protein